MVKTFKQAQRVLNEVQIKFGGTLQCNDDGEEFALSDCNGFETVMIHREEDRGEIIGFSLECDNNYYERGEEIRNYITSLE
jgi:hypothetical protein